MGNVISTDREMPPSGYIRCGEDLCYQRPDDDAPEFLCEGDFHVVAEKYRAHGAKHATYGLLLSWTDRTGKVQELEIERGWLNAAGKLIYEFDQRGLTLTTTKDGRKLFLDYIRSQRPERRIRLVPKPVWHGDVYVTPWGAIGQTEDGEEIMLDPSVASDSCAVAHTSAGARR
jgi:hypothetical protein